MNMHQAFRDNELVHPKAADFLAANPVPYNFAAIVRDYRLMDVFGK